MQSNLQAKPSNNQQDMEKEENEEDDDNNVQFLNTMLFSLWREKHEKRQVVKA